MTRVGLAPLAEPENSVIGAECYVINPASQPYLPKREHTLPSRGPGPGAVGTGCHEF
jgi:hypothetical protein